MSHDELRYDLDDLDTMEREEADDLKPGTLDTRFASLLGYDPTSE